MSTDPQIHNAVARTKVILSGMLTMKVQNAVLKHCSCTSSLVLKITWFSSSTYRSCWNMPPKKPCWKMEFLSSLENSCSASVSLICLQVAVQLDPTEHAHAMECLRSVKRWRQLIQRLALLGASGCELLFAVVALALTVPKLLAHSSGHIPYVSSTAAYTCLSMQQ